ncbi:MAG: 3'(2'),5'-bisphosphate nucleotidase CysQ [Bauldia litoralis]
MTDLPRRAAPQGHGSGPLATLPDGALDAVVEIARRAGTRILDFYRGDYDVEHKADESPVTVADRAADAIIVPALEALSPHIPVVSEERAARSMGEGCFWLVDPLDGTKEFINHRDEFTVNVALIEGGRPVMGVVGLPVADRIYSAFGPGTAAVIEGDAAPRPIAARAVPADGLTVAASRSHANKEELDHFLEGRAVAERITAGSSLKFCLVAEGRADLYPRFGPTMEWDTAAGQAVAEAAGGSVRTLDGAPLGYGKPNFRNPHFLVRGRDG